MNINLYNKFGPIITDEESDDILITINDIFKKDDIVSVDFTSIVAMTTKGAKKIFGSLYLEFNQKEFYRKVNIKNASPAIKEIIYDSIVNSIKTKGIK